MRPSPFVLENPNVLLVSELDWPPERDRIPHETAFLLCPRPMRSHAIGVAESLPRPAPQGRLIALYGEGGSQQAAFENLQASATARLVLAARRPPAPNVLCLMQAPQPFSLGQCQPMLREMRQWWPRTGFLYGHRQASEALHRMALLLPAA